MFSLISSNGTPGATTIRQANGGHHLTHQLPGARGYCGGPQCYMSRNGRRTSLYLRRLSVVRSEQKAAAEVADSAAPSLCQSRRASVDLSASKPDFQANEDRLLALRQKMASHQLTAYVVASEDAHQSEYTSEVDQRRTFISGFDGSAGVAVIVRDLSSCNPVPSGEAALSTDGRYFTQASQQLGPGWRLLKQGVPGEPTWQQWVAKQAVLQSQDCGEVARIGCDPKLLTFDDVESLKKTVKSELAAHAGVHEPRVEVVSVRDNLVDEIRPEFEENPPTRLFKPVLVLSEKYTGESTLSKLKRFRKKCQERYGCSVMALNALDEIAWILNIRGDDIVYNPLFYSYLIIGDDGLKLYTDHHERFDHYKSYLKQIGCVLKPYNSFWVDLRQLGSKLHAQHKQILLTKAASWRMANCIIGGNFTVAFPSPLQGMKEVKNSVEISGQRLAQEKDGLALVRYFSWLEKKLVKDQGFVNEYDAGLKLLHFRKQLDGFRGLSFETISSTGSNGAIIHYAPSSEHSTVINPNKLYLCDSGSQFLDGTTDTTRTLHFGTPTTEEKTNYTLVLKGQIALAQLKFPEGLTGLQIDCFARQFLWQHGLDYAHGTGHGVDSYGPVHSMGVGIGFRAYCNDNVVRAGHVISDEPGYYKPDYYGIRLENMVVCHFDEDQPLKFNGRRFLKFETVTRVPYCRRLIDTEMLTESEKKWVDEFHEKVWKLYQDKLESGSWTYEWLKRETSPL